ncbi:MAG: pyridoxine 5'-phosphate synthase [Alphaproteobacteria bacterium]|nr:pyridoxine 5'-phosphate synthase [Alphaproteobacteria bacterium]
MLTKLSVNLNAVAQLRNRRDLPWPDLSLVGHIALNAGAAGLTVHPRPDERHIRRDDLLPLSALVATFPGCEYNIEGYPDSQFLELVERVKPHQVTLVPDKPEQLTSDHGWNFQIYHSFLKSVVHRLKDQGMRLSLFCDADVEMACRAAETGTDRVELYTGPYGAAYDDPEKAQSELDKLVVAAESARACGLGINAGHDLTLANITALVQSIPFLEEVSIGHSLTADSLIYGMEMAVQHYCRAIGQGGEEGFSQPALVLTGLKEFIG